MDLRSPSLQPRGKRKDWTGSGGGKMELGTFSMSVSLATLREEFEFYPREARALCGAAL